MPGPAKNFTPQRATPSRPARRFTLKQANSTLPLVKRIVGDIVRTHATAAELQGKLEEASGSKQLALQSQLEEQLDKLQDLVDELSEVGCELKDSQSGLVDFLGRHSGRDVCLCWKHGEEMIGHWHEMQSGFAGRQPVSMLRED
jgi:hypothetical protein